MAYTDTHMTTHFYASNILLLIYQQLNAYVSLAMDKSFTFNRLYNFVHFNPLDFSYLAICLLGYSFFFFNILIDPSCLVSYTNTTILLYNSIILFSLFYFNYFKHCLYPYPGTCHKSLVICVNIML